MNLERQRLIRLIEPIMVEHKKRDGWTASHTIRWLTELSDEQIQTLYYRNVASGVLQERTIEDKHRDAAQDHHDALIEAIVSLDTDADREVLSHSTTDELETMLAERVEEEADVLAAGERGAWIAEKIGFALREKERRDADHAKKLAAWEQTDHETFDSAAKILRTFAVNDANFKLVRDAYGPGFTADQVRQIAANPKVLSPATQDELDQWHQDDIVAHNKRLLALDPIELRKQARLENVARTVQFQEEEDRREVEGTERRDVTLDFPELPLTNSSGENLDAKFFMRADAGILRRYIKVYGPAQITKAIRERI